MGKLYVYSYRGELCNVRILIHVLCSYNLFHITEKRGGKISITQLSKAGQEEAKSFNNDTYILCNFCFAALLDESPFKSAPMLPLHPPPTLLLRQHLRQHPTLPRRLGNFQSMDVPPILAGIWMLTRSKSWSITSEIILC